MTLWELLSTSRHTCEMKFTVMHLTFEAGDPATCCRCRGEQWARDHKKEWLAGAKICKDQVNYCVWDLGVPKSDEIRREK